MSLLGEAVEHSSPEERAAFLDKACAGDAGRRARVEELLRAHQAAGNFLQGNRPPAEPVATADEPISEGPGTVIGHYKLLEQIGEGGFGAVFMAAQQEPIRRKVALKVLKPGMDSTQVIARFQAERQALALMDHPHIAKVLDAGQTGSGRPYFVMELVKGLPITEFCDQAQLTPRERLELFVQVCQAVQHAHQKGVIHRDIKPSNVLVTLHDGTPAAKVIDFGVAKALGQELTDKTLFTGFAQMIGTPLYMSPEQAGQSGVDIDTRSDIYSLGVLLYELLTGTTPIDKDRLTEVGYDELRRIIREEESPRPSTRISTLGQASITVSSQRKSDPKRLSQLCRDELDWIVMKCLEKDRNRRYETASALTADVQRYLADEPVLACPPSAWYRFGKFARRNKGWLAVSGGVFLVVTVLAATIGWAVGDRAARRASVAVQVRDSLNVARTLIAENRLAAARQKLAEARAQLGHDRAALGSLAAEVEAGEAELDQYQQFQDLIDRAHQAETAPVLEARLAADGSRSRVEMLPRGEWRWEWRPAEAVPFLLEALERYEILERDDWTTTLEGGLLGKDQIEHVRRLAYEELLWLADDVLSRQQEHRSGRKLSPAAAARAALVYLGKAESAHRPTQAFHVLRGRCRQTLGGEAAARADRQLAAKTPPALAADHYLRGRAAYDAKQLAEGVQAFEAALRVEPTHYWSLMWLGSCLCDLGQGPEDYAGAARVFTGCILKRPEHAHAYFYRALAYSKLRRYEEAVADCSRAIELDPKHSRAWNNRGVAYLDLGQPAKAVADFSRAIELDPKHAHARGNRGIAYLDLGQPAKAIADFSRAIELDPKLAAAWNGRGIAYCDHLGQPAKAVADFSRAIELDPKEAKAWHNRGNAYSDLRQYDKAIADFSRAIELNPKFAPFWYNRGCVYSALGQWDKAVADYSRAIELDPKHAQAWNNRGYAYLTRGQWDKAIADFSRAVELNPNLVNAWSGRGIAYSKLGQYDRAIADHSTVIELDPKEAKAWYNRGLAYSRLGQLDKAVADSSRAIKVNPKYALAYLLRAQTYSRLGRFAQARADYQTFLKLEPANAYFHNHLAWLLATYPDAKLRDPQQAVKLASKAVQLAPKEGGYWNTLGVAHYRAGDWKAAVAALNKSVERKGGDASAWLFLAMAHHKLGNHDEGRKRYDQAVEWMNKNKAALEKDRTKAEELRRFHREAEEVLQLKKK